MFALSPAILNRYLEDDWINRDLVAAAAPGDEAMTCHRWLAESPAKRLLFDALYSDLLKGSGRRILDVGGGLTGLTRRLLRQHDYQLVDLLAHDNISVHNRFRSSIDKAFLHVMDWYDLEIDIDYDVVIANDLFPNADQRLTLFIEKFLPKCREMRLSLTYYNEPRFYLARRLDAAEVLCMLAWTGKQVRLALDPYASRIASADLDILEKTLPSLYPNRRQVCVLQLYGDLRQRGTHS